jgi:hypothetical protein
MTELSPLGLCYTHASGKAFIILEDTVKSGDEWFIVQHRASALWAFSSFLEGFCLDSSFATSLIGPVPFTISRGSPSRGLG